MWMPVSDDDHTGKSDPCDLCLRQTQSVYRSHDPVGQALECSEFAGDHLLHHVHMVGETLGLVVTGPVGADAGILGGTTEDRVCSL